MTAAKSTKRKSGASRPSLAVSLMGRVGYAARGTIYLLIGISAGRTTLDPGHRPGGLTQSLKLFQHYWAGGIVLVLLAFGLACFAGWLAVAAVYRRDHPGRAHYALVAGMLGDAAVYVGFVGSVLGMLFGAWSGGGDDELQSWIGWLVGGVPGRVLVGLAGAIVCGCGAGLVAWGAFGDIEGPLELPPAEKRLVQPIGRYGTGGRGVAIALVGVFLVISAIHSDPHDAHELGGVLRELRGFSYGAAVTAAFALAFVGSAIFDFVIAGFRRFNPRDP
ncbi:MAG TPA: DUF1206 domain-containing protein [Stellaceae bacterium]|nr:DUF1206 domain-containing protein [Stellaceae bacterium]